LLPLPLSGFVGANEPIGLVGTVVGRRSHVSKYPNFQDSCKQPIWLPSQKGLDYATGGDGNAPKTLLAALLIFFRDVPAGAAFRERFAKNPGAARITMRAQAHLEQDGTCMIDNKSGDRGGVHRALGGEGLRACSGDILLESLVACAGVTLGQIAKAMEADFWRHAANEILGNDH
jgi:hypothetical protein